VAHRTLSGTPTERSAYWPLLGILGAQPLKFTGLSGETTEQRSTSPKGRLRVQSTAPEVRSQSTSTGHIGLSGVSIDKAVSR
jgi:hypothetical protein